ncbi:MAG: hypothetical protein OXU61_00595 [Gammaproteobacteria bacterium]|nr:hypothetical protein [Gammaproteobacteria bacterium]
MACERGPDGPPPNGKFFLCRVGGAADNPPRSWAPKSWTPGVGR